MTEPPSQCEAAAAPNPLRWRALPTVLFITNLSLLLAAGISSLTMTPTRPKGLPDDAAASVVRNVVGRQIAVSTGSLRWQAAVLGGTPIENRSPDAAMLARISQARSSLAGVAKRHPRDPRANAALGAMALAVHDHTGAAHHYRAACERAPHYGEGRLGLGVALALRAELTPELWQGRQLRLEAIAQFAAVDAVDSLHRDALYNRALLLAEVGRGREAARYAKEWLVAPTTAADAAPMRELASER